MNAQCGKTSFHFNTKLWIWILAPKMNETSFGASKIIKTKNQIFVIAISTKINASILGAKIDMAKKKFCSKLIFFHEILTFDVVYQFLLCHYNMIFWVYILPHKIQSLKWHFFANKKDKRTTKSTYFKLSMKWRCSFFSIFNFSCWWEV